MTQEGKCLIHEDGKHSTEQCKVYSSKSIDDKKTLLKEKKMFAGLVLRSDIGLVYAERREYAT